MDDLRVKLASDAFHLRDGRMGPNGADAGLEEAQPAELLRGGLPGSNFVAAPREERDLVLHDPVLARCRSGKVPGMQDEKS